MLARRYRVRGRVQGVGFRYFACRVAEQLGVRGWVRNLSSGDVEIHAEGDPASLENFLEQIKQGPRYAVVKNVEIEEAQAVSYASFFVKG
ncbi:MAG: acylphosphatase [Acidobacteria bacterium]|nr:acylphosphatase [Acidobacteriota bacterium]